GEVGEERMMAGMINNIANAYNYLEQPVRAREELATAFQIIERKPDDRYSAAMLATMGGTYLRERDPAAVGYFKQSLHLHRRLANRSMEAEALRLIGDSFASTADYQSALTYYRQAIDIQ